LTESSDTAAKAILGKEKVMIVHCEKHEDGFFYCHELQTVGRREEDVQLEQELMAMFPGMLKEVRLVREGQELMGGNASGARHS
jgi:hypothetical protein